MDGRCTLACMVDHPLPSLSLSLSGFFRGLSRTIESRNRACISAILSEEAFRLWPPSPLNGAVMSVAAAGTFFTVVCDYAAAAPARGHSLACMTVNAGSLSAPLALCSPHHPLLPPSLARSLIPNGPKERLTLSPFAIINAPPRHQKERGGGDTPDRHVVPLGQQNFT